MMQFDNELIEIDICVIRPQWNYYKELIDSRTIKQQLLMVVTVLVNASQCLLDLMTIYEEFGSLKM